MMFRRAHIKLTIFYSLLFIFSFWLFSFGLYLWMDNSFGGSYINQVQQEQGEFGQQDVDIATLASGIAMDRLRSILLILNGSLIIIVPAIAWFMTRRTLAPVQQIHEQQKQFVSDAAHELRTPLSIMSGEMEVMLKQDRTLVEYKEAISNSKEEADRLSNLVENLLFLARRNQGKQSVEFELVDITDLIGSIIASLQSESRDKHISLTLNPEAEPTFISGQPTMLRRLFLNIIHNAILYTPDEGNVCVSLSSNNQYTHVDIKDTGIGIAPDNQQKIFDRFYRVDSSRSQTRGYGLGLAICKSIVELHRGKISVISALGQGSTFTVIFPKTKK